MDSRIWCLLFITVIPACRAWHPMSDRREDGELRKPHYHAKRHMLPNETSDIKRRTTTQKPREMRKKNATHLKPSGHLTPLDDDDMENDEFVSVAIGPPPLRPKSTKSHRKPSLRPKPNITSNTTSTNLVKDVLTQLGREFLTYQVSEDFVFGQYIGNSMKNLTQDLKLKMQHEILDVIMKYQKINNGDVFKMDDKSMTGFQNVKDKKISNDTDEWPDFSNLDKIVL